MTTSVRGVQRILWPFDLGILRTSCQQRFGIRHHTQQYATQALRRNAYLQVRQPSMTWRSRLSGQVKGLRQNSTKRPQLQPAQEQITPPKAQSQFDKFKELSRKYGWAAVGVYFGLSALDFPFCFVAVRLLGTERIGQAEHWVVDNFWKLVSVVMPNVGERQTAPVGAEAGTAVEAAKAASGHATASESHVADMERRIRD